MAAPARRRAAVIASAVAGTGALLGGAALGYGGVAPLLAHPARAAFVAASLVLTLAALASPVNLSSGEREDVGGRRVFVPTLGLLALFWLGPWMDRRGLWTIDGAAARWLGLALFVVGSVLRVWPMFVLGDRFSGLVAIQPGHQLETRGPYRWVRNPSYLGMLVGLAGWALVSASGALQLASDAIFHLVAVAMTDPAAPRAAMIPVMDGLQSGAPPFLGPFAAALFGAAIALAAGLARATRLPALPGARRGRRRAALRRRRRPGVRPRPGSG